MKMEDMILISVDDHFVEPPTMFDRHTPAHLKGQMPKMVKTPEGADAWSVGGHLIRSFGLNAVVGRAPEELGMEPTSLDQLRRGCYDVHARVDDMNVNGILGSMNFPSFIGVAGQTLATMQDKTLALSILQAWNDWHIDEWCGAFPERFIPLCVAPVWNPEQAAAEIRRMAAKGCHALSFPHNPKLTGQPSIHQPYWEPVWQACADSNVVICIHFSDSAGAAPSDDTPIDAYIANMQVGLYATASDLTYSHILRKYPDIRFALSEGSIGWVPHMMERIDMVRKQHGAWTNQDFAGKLPSEVFREHVYLCFISDRAGIKLRHDIGIENIAYECDYPHADCQWPLAPEVLWPELEGVPDHEINMITHLNSMRQYTFNPFARIDKKDATVGALRAKGAGVDISYMKGRGGLVASRNKEPVRMRHIREQLSYSSDNKEGTSFSAAG
jgi:predicted TIM-barrel fold metal-dependent hydrolase